MTGILIRSCAVLKSHCPGGLFITFRRGIRSSWLKLLFRLRRTGANDLTCCCGMSPFRPYPLAVPLFLFPILFFG